MAPTRPTPLAFIFNTAYSYSLYLFLIYAQYQIHSLVAIAIAIASSPSQIPHPLKVARYYSAAVLGFSRDALFGLLDRAQFEVFVVSRTLRRALRRFECARRSDESLFPF